ncbi:MAG: 5'-methylthioadenosine/adenosylhomocysteine nucleosidase [Prevotella sp.]
MIIGIIVAMDKEFVQLRALLENQRIERHNNIDFVIGEIACKTVIVQKCGIGKVNSAIGTVELINNYTPDLIVSTGVAGGIDVDMNVTDVVVGTGYCYHDVYCGNECVYGQIMGMPPMFRSSNTLVEKAVALSGKTTIHKGLIVTGDWFVDSSDKMRDILEHFPNAKAVDMESCSIAQTCSIYGVPFISFRIISDIPLKDNNASQYYDFWSRLAESSFNITRRFIESV